MAGNLFEKASEAFGKGMDAAGEMFGKSVDAASDMFDKGVNAASGLASSAGDLGKRGVARAKLADANLEYERLMKKLGTVLYEELKDDPKYAEAHEDLFREIETCVERRQGLEDEIAAIDAAADVAKPIDVKPVAPEGAGEEPAAAEQATGEAETEGEPASETGSATEEPTA